MWARGLMNERVTSEERRQSPREEVANAVGAGVGLIAAIAGIPLLFCFRNPTGQRLDRWRCGGIRCDDRLAVISHRRSITRCRELGQSGCSAYSTTWESFF